MKKILAILVLSLSFAFPASAQVNGGSAPYLFSPNTTISSSEVNQNFAKLFTDSLDRTGGTLTGTLTSRSIVPAADDTYDLGSTLLRFRNIFVVGAIAAGGSGSFSAPVDITSTSGSSQLVLKYDNSNYLGVKVGATGTTTYDAAGSGASHVFADPVTAQSTLAVTGDLTASSQIFGKLGTVGSPSFAFTGDSDTGMYSAGTGANDYRFAWAIDGVWFAGFHLDGNATPAFDIIPGAFGTGPAAGGIIGVGNNTSGNGAAGSVALYQKNGSYRFIWADATNLIRTASGPPREDGLAMADTGGVVVGDQTSSLDTKENVVLLTDTNAALQTILRTPVFSFNYKDGRYNNETFKGIITDYSPEFGKDAGKSLNEINAIGLLIQAIQEQQKQIEALQARVTALEARR